MKIRAVSDLHIDINRRAPLRLSDDVFTVVAGDICGSPEGTAKWAESNIKHGAFISGNHDVYDASMPIESIKSMLSLKFPESGEVTYLDNDIGCISKEIGENVLLIGDVMYTDYSFKCGRSLYSNDPVNDNMYMADPVRNFSRGGMNDFNYGLCMKHFPGKNDRVCGADGSHRLVPEYYLEHFISAFEAVNELVEKNPSKDIILVTHHCLSKKCISSDYVSDRLNASYVTDKDEWILAHPNIKAIVSGHVHHKAEFKVGDTLYVMNPLGYYCWERHDKTFELDDCLIDTSTWTAEWKRNALKCG